MSPVRFAPFPVETRSLPLVRVIENVTVWTSNYETRIMGLNLLKKRTVRIIAMVTVSEHNYI